MWTIQSPICLETNYGVESIKNRVTNQWLTEGPKTQFKLDLRLKRKLTPTKSQEHWDSTLIIPLILLVNHMNFEQDVVSYNINYKIGENINRLFLAVKMAIQDFGQWNSTTFPSTPEVYGKEMGAKNLILIRSPRSKVLRQGYA